MGFPAAAIRPATAGQFSAERCDPKSAPPKLRTGFLLHFPRSAWWLEPGRPGNGDQVAC